MSNLTPVDAALAQLLAGIEVIAGVETIDLARTPGRILAADLRAPLDVPPADNSAMDGYAVLAGDLDTIPCRLPVTQRIAAGHTGHALEAGSAARIFTGAPIPPGADAVVMQENTRGSDAEVEILQPVEPGENIRSRGEDIRSGEILLEAGHRLAVQDLHLLAASGLHRIEVRKPLRVAMLATGDELVQPGASLGPGQIYNSNFHVVAGLLRALAMEVMDFGVVADDRVVTRERLREAADQADCIITSGGVSVGEEDHVKAVVQELGSLDLWKLAIKPGKPFAWGQIAGRPFFGLPGNPVSAFVTFVLLVRPALLSLAGAKVGPPHSFRLPVDFEKRSGDRQEYLRVRLLRQGQAGLRLALHFNQSSGVGSSLSVADGLAILPPFTSIGQGDMLEFIPMSELIG